MKRCVNKKSFGGRVKPVIAKVGVTKNRARRYGCGGKVKNK